MSVISDRIPGRKMTAQSGRNYGRFVNNGSNSESEAYLGHHFSSSKSEVPRRMTNNREAWDDNSTVVTTNSSEVTYNWKPNNPILAPEFKYNPKRKTSLFWSIIIGLFTFFAIISSPVMSVLPMFLYKYDTSEWPTIQCELGCQVSWLSLVVLSILLFVALRILYWRRELSELPRLYRKRACISALSLFVLFSAWLIYYVRIIYEKETNYDTVMIYALFVVVIMLFIQCFGILMEIRKEQPQFTISIVRNPDGLERTMNIGKMSLQEAGVKVIQFYFSSFPSYNFHLDKQVREGGRHFKSSSSAIAPGFKMYDIEGISGQQHQLSEANAHAIIEAASRRRHAGHSEIMKEEFDMERRIKRKKYRLLSCAEEAFAHIQSISSLTANENAFIQESQEASKAARTVFNIIVRPLTKYLKLSRQQTNHPATEVMRHIENCLTLKLSAKTFLQRFFSDKFPVKMEDDESKWSIVSNESSSSTITPNKNFLLRCHSDDPENAIQLYCTISHIPFINLLEQSGTLKTDNFYKTV